MRSMQNILVLQGRLLHGIGLIFATLALTFLLSQNAQATVSVSCSGTSGAPTAVDEASLSGQDVTFTNGGGSGYCALDNPISAASVMVNTGVTITHTASDTDGITITTTGDFISS